MFIYQSCSKQSQVKNSCVTYIAKTTATNHGQGAVPEHFQGWYNAIRKITKDLSN